MIQHSELKKLQIFTINIDQIEEMPNMRYLSKNVNKREIFQKLFSSWIFNPKATSYANFKILGYHLLQNMIFIRIHVIWGPTWFSRPGAHQGQFFWSILWPMVSTIIGQKFWGVLLRLLRWHFSAVSTFRTVSVKSDQHNFNLFARS